MNVVTPALGLVKTLSSSAGQGASLTVSAPKTSPSGMKGNVSRWTNVSVILLVHIDYIVALNNKNETDWAWIERLTVFTGPKLHTLDHRGKPLTAQCVATYTDTTICPTL